MPQTSISEQGFVPVDNACACRGAAAGACDDSRSVCTHSAIPCSSPNALHAGNGACSLLERDFGRGSYSLCQRCRALAATARTYQRIYSLGMDGRCLLHRHFRTHCSWSITHSGLSRSCSAAQRPQARRVRPPCCSLSSSRQCSLLRWILQFASSPPWPV